MNEQKLKLFSYVVEHDDGFAPNPFHGYCTLAHCKFKGENSHRSEIEMSKEFFDNGHDIWVLGTGGNSKKSTGHNTIVYLMKINEILSLHEYYIDSRFSKKKPKDKNDISKLGDNLEMDYNGREFSNERLVLISKTFWYFGRDAINIPKKFTKIQKKGPGFKRNFDGLDKQFITWFQNDIAPTSKTGAIGNPVKNLSKSKCNNTNESITSACRN